jgi:hypothetical protein
MKNTLRIPWNGGNSVEARFLEERGWIPLEITKRRWEEPYPPVWGEGERVESKWVKEANQGFKYPGVPDLSGGLAGLVQCTGRLDLSDTRMTFKLGINSRNIRYI